MTEFEKKYYRDRQGSGSVKWDGLEAFFGDGGLMPLWVADMDFSCPDCVRQAMEGLAQNNLYGYFMPPQDAFDAFYRWERDRHGYEIKPEWVRYTHGVVTAIYRLISALTQKGDACAILTPSYYPFMDAVRDTGRRLVCSRLKNDGGYYTPDYKDFEKKIIENRVKLFIMSSPQNPVGRIWKREELAALLDICARHKVYVISDEIHQDIELFGNKHTPAALTYPAEDFLITVTAATKTFNLAGLSHSTAIIESEEIRRRYDEYAKTLHGGDNITGYVAAAAAYVGGEKWLSDCLLQTEHNAMLIKSELERGLPAAVLSPLEGTYLQWIDLGAYLTADKIEAAMKEKCRLAVDYGSQFFPDNEPGECHIRVNLATSSENIKEAARRLALLARG